MLLPGNTVTTSLSTTECSTTIGEDTSSEIGSPSSGVVESDEGVIQRHDDRELLQRMSSRHYYSTTTALAITVGVGCILLILNMLIFAGIYYQRDREKKRAASECAPANSNQESLPMTTRPSSRDSNDDNRSEEPPPSYTTLARASPPPPSSTMPEQRLVRDTETLTRTMSRKDHPIPPKPPTRTTSSLTTVTGVKKRVQIQEISV